MYILITILIVIASILLTLLVLVQNSKGGGLASGFSSSNQIMGVRKTTDFLEKATWALIAFVAVFAVLSAGVHPTTQTEKQSEIREEFQDTKDVVPGFITPDFNEIPEGADNSEAE